MTEEEALVAIKYHWCITSEESYAKYDSSEYSTLEEALAAGKKEFEHYNKDLYKLQVFIYKGNNKIKYL